MRKERKTPGLMCCERGENRGAAEEREDGRGGRLEEGLDGQSERGQKEERRRCLW